jgi:hypothetical protein
LGLSTEQTEDRESLRIYTEVKVGPGLTLELARVWKARIVSFLAQPKMELLARTGCLCARRVGGQVADYRPVGAAEVWV